MTSISESSATNIFQIGTWVEICDIHYTLHLIFTKNVLSTKSIPVIEISFFVILNIFPCLHILYISTLLKTEIHN